jgi:hypothetical protein
MIQNDFTMGDFCGLKHLYFTSIVTLATGKTLYLVFAGLGPESSPLIFRLANGAVAFLYICTTPPCLEYAVHPEKIRNIKNINQKSIFL